ncbi:MAG: DEAD/DEAH box helicase family protein [Alphaproteobacteria bacterium]|nr:DEAD/DEAH box helicase family protein [Alphaproteobacteria bacterium]
MITLNKGQYLSDVMKEIPTNCILSKRIPGCGATTLELETDRSSIIVVPNVPVIISKCSKYPNLLGVYEKVDIGQIIEYLRTNRLHKIMTTPESMCKVKTACERCGINIYTDFFLLMDECHQLIKDVDYRENIVLHMKDFFLFHRKALVSATPIGFSDPRFEENHFETVEVMANYDYQQEITVTRTYNMAKAVGEYLENHNGTICFFVNSVVEIYSIMKHFDLLEDSTVYCAPKSRNKLKTEYNFTNTYTEWSADTMRKYNFFTGRFFTAFDLELDYTPDLVMITDPYHAEYSMLDVNTDCIQICGRFRNGISSATHIYRVNPEIIIKSKEQVEWEISAHEFAYMTINTLYNSADNKEARFAFGEVLKTLPFRKYQYPDFTKNWFAVDNTIDETLVNNHYQSYIAITKWYTDCHFFNPTFTQCEYNENDEKLKFIRAARSVKDKRRKIVQRLSEIEQPTSEYALDFISDIRQIDSFIVDAYEVLGKERIEELKYSEKKIREDMIFAERKGNKVVRLIKNKFTVGGKYFNDTIVNEIARIFERLYIHPEKEIKPNIILDYYQAVPFKSNGKRGYQLISELI